jgi:hypothetical protein
LKLKEDDVVNISLFSSPDSFNGAEDPQESRGTHFEAED